HADADALVLVEGRLVLRMVGGGGHGVGGGLGLLRVRRREERAGGQQKECGNEKRRDARACVEHWDSPSSRKVCVAKRLGKGRGRAGRETGASLKLYGG